ncbi:AraC-like DNA-binding protein [Nocardia transvalensis]|uniref:AraC-like DNA-binding protein n=1 Tax=Nocardia transvalensis TaxID=37333 RepID=A0A7W9UJ71_9NOCA|nr:AraC family transcriptional regulator [Nocardia transvalensis]MBB5915031.1 AraC-like DNA-binding protein [Nocardia transvalensis]
MSVIRSAGLRGFRATVAELGGDAEEFAVAAGLPIGALDADDLLVSDQAMALVLEIAAERLRCPDLGLRIATRQDLGMLGPLALAIRSSPTLADALECTSRYLFVHARSLSLTLEPDPYGDRGVTALHYGVRPGVPILVQGTDLGLGFLHRALRRLVDGPYGLRSVELPYRPPGSASAYEEFFGAPVRFGRPAAILRVPSSLASRTVAGSDETLRRLALAFLAEQSADGGVALEPKVRAAVQQLLGTAAPEIAAVARLLTLHPRTLQRRLAAEGTSFAAILDDVRRTEARRYLTTTDLPMSQIASLLGLAEQSTLTRAVQRWWNTTPTALRRG